MTSSSIIDVSYVKLDAGDYTVEGMEDILAIERKMSVAEFAKNVTEKRFSDWLSRMSKCKHAHIIIEEDIENIINYPVGSSIPKNKQGKIRISGSYLMKCISQIQVKYGIHFNFCHNAQHAELTAINIMKRVVELENEED